MSFGQELLTEADIVIKGSLSTFQEGAHILHLQEGHQNSFWLVQDGVETAGQT